jgi:hypothetical protein
VSLDLTPGSGHTRGMRSMAIGLFVAVFVAACGSPEGQLFRTALPTSDYAPLPVLLRDTTGLVTGIEPATYDERAFLEPLVEADPADPGAFIVSWLGGLDEGEAAFTFSRSDSTYALQLAVRPKGGTGFPALGVGRGLRVKTSSPIAPDSILLSGGA